MLRAHAEVADEQVREADALVAATEAELAKVESEAERVYRLYMDEGLSATARFTDTRSRSPRRRLDDGLAQGRSLEHVPFGLTPGEFVLKLASALGEARAAQEESRITEIHSLLTNAKSETCSNCCSVGELDSMLNKATDTEIRRMAKIRKIASGIFDNGERKVVLGLVADYEKLAGLKAV